MSEGTDPSTEVREAALRLLARRACATGELAERLVSGGHDPAVVDRVLRRLAECGLLDDEAYARRLAEAAIEKKPMAAALVQRRLEARRIPPAIAERVAAEVLAGVDPAEAAAGLARRMLAARGGRATPSDRRRIGAALSRRGFDADIICEALQRAGLPDDSLDQEHGP